MGVFLGRYSGRRLGFIFRGDCVGENVGFRVVFLFRFRRDFGSYICIVFILIGVVGVGVFSGVGVGGVGIFGVFGVIFGIGGIVGNVCFSRGWGWF